MRTINLKTIICFLALLLLSACPKPPASVGTTPGSGTTETVKRAKNYNFPLPADVKSLDPAHITDTVSDSVAQRLYNRLVKFNTDGSVKEDLAESYSISEDGMVYSFTLREGVKFHNGDPLSVDDVIYSYTRLVSPSTASERANLLYYVQGAREMRDDQDGKITSVSGLQKVDDRTMTISLSAPYAPFLNVLCMTTFGVVPKSEVERDEKGFGSNPVGTGPFVFDNWTPDERVVLKANRTYFGHVPEIETLTFRIINDENTRFENFRNGTLEHCDIPPSKIKTVMDDPELKQLIAGEPAMDMYGYGFNCEQVPFKDNAALRQAFNYAVDKQNIIDNVWAGLVTEQKTIVPAGMFYFDNSSQGFPYNPDKAAELLVQAGYPKGEGLPPFTLNIDLQPTNKLVAEAVQEDLSRIGIKVNIETTDWGPFLDKVYAGNSLFFQNTWLGDYPDPDNWLYQLLHTENFGDAGNISRWSNSRFDALVTEAQTEPDQAQRNELYMQAEGIALSEAPWLLLFWKNSSTLVQPYVKGLKITKMDRTPQLNNAPIEDVTYSD
jgi:peptide/nickel transport system substrate-binding protein/oligopeptide transport system substrate-binding protein